MVTLIHRVFLRLPVLLVAIAVANPAVAQTTTTDTTTTDTTTATTTATALTTTPGASPVTLAQFQAQYAALMANFQQIGTALNNQQILDNVQKGQNAMNQVTPDQWNAYVSQPGLAGTVPDYSALVNASNLAVARVNALVAAPMQATQDFPTFGPNYPGCSDEYNDPGFKFGIFSTSLILGSIMDFLQFVCNEQIPIPLLGDLNFAFVCIGISVAQGVLGLISDQMSVCGVINGRASSQTMYQAEIYVDNLLDQSSNNLQTLMTTNTNQLLTQLNDAQTAINTFETQLETSLISEIGAAITTSQNALVSEAINTGLASVQNSIINTTATLITTAQTDIINNTNQQTAAVIANSDAQAASILAALDTQTQAALANLEADSREITNTMLQLGCEDLRLQATTQKSSNLAICQQTTPSVSTNLVSLATTPATSSAASTTATAAPTGVTVAALPLSGGCSGMGTPNGLGNVPMMVALLLSGLFLRRKKTMIKAVNPYFILGVIAIFMQAALPASAQTTPTVATFRAEYQEAMGNLQQYFQASGNVDGANAVQNGLTNLSLITDAQLTSYFAQVPADNSGATIPDLSQLVSLSQTFVTSLPAAQAKPLDLLTPPAGFPAFGTDYCPLRTPNSVIYGLTLAKDVIDVIMSVVTWICYQAFPEVGTPIMPVCIALGAVQAAVQIAQGVVLNCAYVEGSSPDYNALDFIQQDITNQFAALSDANNTDTNNLSQEIVNVETSVTNNDFAAYTAVLNATNADISAEQNSLVADVSSSLSAVAAAIVTTTTENLTNATNAIEQNTNAQSAAIIADANKQAAAILAKAVADANTILANVKAATSKVLQVQSQLGCQNIAAEVAGTSSPLSSITMCAGQPGF